MDLQGVGELMVVVPGVGGQPGGPADPSGAGNQAHLQSLDALKAGITRDHHGIGSAQPMVGAQLRRQLHHRGAELHNQQIRLGKQRLKTIQAG